MGDSQCFWWTKLSQASSLAQGGFQNQIIPRHSLNSISSHAELELIQPSTHQPIPLAIPANLYFAIILLLFLLFFFLTFLSSQPTQSLLMARSYLYWEVQSLQKIYIKVSQFSNSFQTFFLTVFRLFGQFQVQLSPSLFFHSVRWNDLCQALGKQRLGNGQNL